LKVSRSTNPNNPGRKDKAKAPEETLKRIPTLQPSGLQGGVAYYDGQFDDSRLAVNLAQTVFDLAGAAIRYFKVTALNGAKIRKIWTFFVPNGTEVTVYTEQSKDFALHSAGNDWTLVRNGARRHHAKD
jgi:glycerol-3-phosphate dehydrogenase